MYVYIYVCVSICIYMYHILYAFAMLISFLSLDRDPHWQPGVLGAVGEQRGRAVPLSVVGGNP